MNAPIPFQGLPDEAAENFRSHRWFDDAYGEIRCYECDAKPWHAGASYPCGVEPPRTDDPRAFEAAALRRDNR